MPDQPKPWYKTLLKGWKETAVKAGRVVYPEKYVPEAAREQARATLEEPEQGETNRGGQARQPETHIRKTGIDAFIDICDNQYGKETVAIDNIYEILRAHIKYNIGTQQSEPIEVRDAEGFAKVVGFDAQNLAHIFIANLSQDDVNLDEPREIEDIINSSSPEDDASSFIFRVIWKMPNDAPYDEEKKKAQILFGDIQSHVPELTRKISPQRMRGIMELIDKMESNMSTRGKPLSEKGVHRAIQTLNIDTRHTLINANEMDVKVAEIWADHNDDETPYWFTGNTAPSPQVVQPLEARQPVAQPQGVVQITENTNYALMLFNGPDTLQQSADNISAIVHELQGNSDVEMATKINALTGDIYSVGFTMLTEWPDTRSNAANLLPLVAKAFDIKTEEALAEKIKQLSTAMASL